MESRSINFYKGIAMLSVIATHVGAGTLPNIYGKIGANGARGVQIFFIISAYLAFVSYNNSLKRNELDTNTAKMWLIKKYKK